MPYELSNYLAKSEPLLAPITLDRFSSSMAALIRNTQTGKTSGTHTMIPTLSNNIALCS